MHCSTGCRPCPHPRCHHRYSNALFSLGLKNTFIQLKSSDMKKLYLLFFLVLQTLAHAQTQEAYFTSYPALTPDGKTVIFSYEGDLWKADINNPVASRITAMQGEETCPRVSP